MTKAYNANFIRKEQRNVTVYNRDIDLYYCTYLDYLNCIITIVEYPWCYNKTSKKSELVLVDKS